MFDENNQIVDPNEIHKDSILYKGNGGQLDFENLKIQKNLLQLMDQNKTPLVLE